MLSLFQFCSSSSRKQLKSCKTLLLWKAESSQSITDFFWMGVLLVGSGNPEVFCHIFFHTFVSVFCPPLTHAIIVPPAIFICGVHTGVYRWEENRFYFVEISILNIYRLSWQSLTKGVIFSKYFVCWMLSYRILLAKY